MHRNPAVFPSPDTFLPDRWLDDAVPAESLAVMNQHFMPFGTGSRVCGGQNLAQAMMKVVVAAVARNFDIEAPAETNERSMEIKDSFVSVLWHVAHPITDTYMQVIFPSAMECKLSFNPRTP